MQKTQDYTDGYNQAIDDTLSSINEWISRYGLEDSIILLKVKKLLIDVSSKHNEEFITEQINAFRNVIENKIRELESE